MTRSDLAALRAAIRRPHVHWVYWSIILVTHAALVVSLELGVHHLPHAWQEHYSTIILAMFVVAERLIWAWADDLAEWVTGTVADASVSTVAEAVGEAISS